MIWYDMIWYDMIWYDMIWYDMIWYDMIWYDMIWYDVIWCDMIWYDMIWYDMIWYDMIWYDMIWYDDKIWHDNFCIAPISVNKIKNSRALRILKVVFNIKVKKNWIKPSLTWTYVSLKRHSTSSEWKLFESVKYYLIPKTLNKYIRGYVITAITGAENPRTTATCRGTSHQVNVTTTVISRSRRQHRFTPVAR